VHDARVYVLEVSQAPHKKRNREKGDIVTMKNLFGLVIGLVILAFIAENGGVKFGSPASPLALPPVQRTAIYAPAEATRQAGGALSAISAGDAAAQELEAARVYAQAAQEQALKAREVATLQAVAATQTANDITVSKEYATLTAVSLHATAQAISMTVAVDREQYAASIAAVKATAQASTDEMMSRAHDVDAAKARSEGMDGLLKFVCLPTIVIMLAIALYALYLTVKRIEPTASQKEIAALRDELDDLRRASEAHDDEEEVEHAPQDASAIEKFAKLRSGRAAAIRYVTDSIRATSGTAAKLLSATEWEALPNGAPRATHTAAVGYLRDVMSAVYVQQGRDQGTYINADVGDLASLAAKIAATPPP